MPVPAAVLNVSYRHRPSEAENADIGPEDSPAVGTNGEGINRLFKIGYDWLLSNRTVISARVVHLDENAERVALTELGFQPAFDPFGLAAMGHVRVGGLFVGGAEQQFNRQDYRSDEVRVTVARPFDAGRLLHQVKVGYTWSQAREHLTRKSNGWGDLSPVIITYNGAPRSVVRALYYPDQPSQISRARTDAIFVQDDVAIGTRLTINAGLLLTRDQFIQDEAESVPGVPAPVFTPGPFLTFGMGAAGATAHRAQLSAAEGQDRQGLRQLGPLLRPRSEERGAQHGLSPPVSGDWRTSTRSLASSWFNASRQERPRRPSRPGFVRRTWMRSSLGTRRRCLTAGRWTRSSCTATPTTSSRISPTVLPESGFVYANDPQADRKYATVMVELNRSLRDRWAMNASYAWSRLSGTFDLDYDLSAPV